MSREAVLDSNVVNSISRKPTTPPNDAITKAIQRRKLQICADLGGGIVDEWQRTANRDVVRQLIVHWQQYKGWRLVEPATLPHKVARALPRLGFKDVVDKLILRTACATNDKHIVSNDPDFWDPLADKDRCVGDPKAVVAEILREELHVTVSTLKAFVEQLG